MRDIKLLDCTLRDGGYINDWKWGYDVAIAIIRLLIRAGIDAIEVGFLRDVVTYDRNTLVCNYIEELNSIVPREAESVVFSAMAMNSNYDITKLSPYSGQGIKMIRVTAHDYDIKEGLEFAINVQKLGYLLSINPINIMGYSDNMILWILERVNKIQPYQFAIVDTFGSMKRRDMERILSLVDHNLDHSIRIALHLHENMSQSFSLAQAFIDKNLNRPVTVDASLMGIGRTPGNLPIELIADYLNEYAEKNYDIDYLMDAIHDYIEVIKGRTEWGYNPTYFLSARYNIHRNYAEHYQNKGDLTSRDINHLLSRIKKGKSTCFDKAYADELYEEYKSNSIDDTYDRERLKKEFEGRTVLVIAPGASIQEKKVVVDTFLFDKKPVVVSLNFVPDIFSVDFAFFSNNKRYDLLSEKNCKVIATSNLNRNKAEFWVNHNDLVGSFGLGGNSLIMLLRLFKDIGIDNVYVAGADGYYTDKNNYYIDSMHSESKRDNTYNIAVSEAIKNVGVRVNYITPSAYETKI